MKKKLVFLFSTIIFFGILIKLEYATDTYAVFNFNAEQIYAQFAASGRFITAVIGKIIKLTNISEQTIYICSYILAIVSAILSQMKLYDIIKKDVKYESLRLIIPILIVLNPFSIELFLFIEKGIMWFGILLAIYAVSETIKYFETKNKKYIFISMILMFMANCSYQGIIGIYI